MLTLIQTLIRSSRLVHPSLSFYAKLKRVKYCARGLAIAGYSNEWLDFLNQPMIAPLAKSHPHLFHKLQRPYLTRNLTRRQRLEALKQHYGFITTSLSIQVKQSVFSRTGLLLAVVPMERIGALELRLRSSDWGQKEGDLMIEITDPKSGMILYSIIFSVLDGGTSRKEIFIGGLQGRKSLDKDFIISMTKDLHGYRPKALLVFALQQLAANWGISSIRAVSDDLHVYRHFQKRQKISSSYDEFWMECNGSRLLDGTFELPSVFKVRELSSIKGSKRKMYRLRSEKLAEVGDQIRINLL